MPLWMYDLPNWMLGVMIMLGWVAAGLGGHALFHRFVRVRLAEQDRNLAIAVLAVMATINSLLLAFSAVSVWESFGNADHAVSSEATTIAALGRDLAVFGSAESRQAREQLKAYARAVISQEWPQMQQLQSSPVAWETFEGMFRAIGDLHPVTPREMALMPEIWARGNELVKFRRNRLEASIGRVPGTLWVVVVLGTLFTLLPTCVLPATAFNRVAIGLLSLSMGLVFFFVAAMDRPFIGKESVAPGPIEMSLSRMELWDARAAPQEAELTARR